MNSIQKQRYVFSRKHKRTYRNLMSGIEKAFMQDLTVRFITFTTSSECVNQSSFNSSTLNRDFVKFIQRVKRLTPNKLKDGDYLSSYQLAYYYGDKEDRSKNPDIFSENIFSELSYFKIHTSEGNGVIHSVFCSPYIPFEYIQDSWKDIHLSTQVNIQLIRPSEVENYSRYIVSQYIANQGDKYLYSSQSKNWLFPGCNDYWEDLKYVHLRDNDTWSQFQYAVDTKESYFCNNKLISDSYKHRINRWMNPPITSETYPGRFETSFEFIKSEWDNAIKQSIEQPDFKYPAKPMVEYLPTELYCYKCHRHVVTAEEPIPLEIMCPHCYEPTTLVNEPYAEFPAIFKKRTNLSQADEKRLSTDVLNSLYVDSRKNPLACVSKHIDQRYYKFVEEKLDFGYYPSGRYGRKIKYLHPHENVVPLNGGEL